MEQYSAMRGGALYPAVIVMQSEVMLLANRLEDAMALYHRALDLARHSKERGSEASGVKVSGVKV
jgi:hypothetical protein